MSLNKKTAAAGDHQKRKKVSMFRITMRRLMKNKMAVFGLIVITVYLVLAIGANFFAPYGPAETDLVNTYATPSAKHLFGTDQLGRDILSRLMIGARYSLSIGIVAVAISATVGITLGAICGYFGGKVDNVIMRILDVFQALPAMILAIAICAALGPGFVNCIIAIAVSGTPPFARMARACVLNIRGEEYLEAATAINCSTFQTITRHVLPNAFSPLIVQITMGIASDILLASNLSFIGLGVQPPAPEWSAMLAAGKDYIRNYPHLTLFPGITIVIINLALNMVGDGLRDALDPKLKD
jgi:peptide/nickel transport system permease protein